ncbi:hypothetical protein Trydic_g10872, partial [Trypoxylus dichotomus]
KRAVMFVSNYDYYVLINGVEGNGEWETIGKENKEGNLTLENCLSYDEIKLSAFLSVSSYSYFVNDGSRRNGGVTAANRSNLQEEGIVIGLIGARMRKRGFMEYQDIVIDQKQNTEANGYGTVSDIYFDNITFAKRIAISIDTLLFEANHRAKEKNTTAFVHVVGIGLGVWKCSVHQEEIFLETFVKRIESLGKYLHNISDIHFAYFKSSTTCGKYVPGSQIPIEDHTNGGIKIFISERQPHEALEGDYKEKLLVVSYAWDGNALPGNEFWVETLSGSSDSAAACSTQVAELHNPHINTNRVPREQ